MGALIPVLCRPPSASAFSPLSLPGLALWLDASDLGTLFQDSALTTAATADGDPVGGWRDKSGNGNHILQATAGKRPTYKTSGGASGLGGKGILFDGVDDFLALAGLNLGASHMIGMLVTLASGAGYVANFKGVGDGSIIAGFSGDFEYYGNPPRVVIAATSSLAAGIHAVSAGGNSGGVTTRIDGAAGGTSGSAAQDFDGGTTIGATASGTDTFGGTISEIVVCTGYSAADLIRLDAYLNARR